MPLVLTFIIFNIHSYNLIIHSFILHHLPRSVLLYLHRFSAQQEKPPWGAEPRIELGPALQQGADARCWATPHCTELRRTLLSYAPYWATPHPTELRRTLLSYAAPYWATLHPTELRCTLLSYAAPCWATPHPAELRTPHPNKATPHPPELQPLMFFSTSTNVRNDLIRSRIWTVWDHSAKDRSGSGCPTLIFSPSF